MRAVEIRATPEKAAQYEYLEEAGVVNRGANESEEALRVVAVKKLGDIRVEQVTLEVKKPSAVARRALLLEAMAEEESSYTAEPGSPRNGRMGPGQHTNNDCEATGGAAGGVFVESYRPRAGSGERPAWLNQMLAGVYLLWADVVLRGLELSSPCSSRVSRDWPVGALGEQPDNDDHGSRNGRARDAEIATAPCQSSPPGSGEMRRVLWGDFCLGQQTRGRPA